MNPAGYWVKPGPGYGPKLLSIVWSLISLAELGASIDEDKRVAVACAYYLDHAFAKGGQITYRNNAAGTADCLQGNMLLSLMDLGCRDKRLDTAYDWMARTVTYTDMPRKINPDGLAPGEGVPGPWTYLNRFGPLFACRTNSDLPCSWAALKVMLAFSRLPVEKRTDLIKRAMDIGVKFFLTGDPAKAEFPGHRTGVPDKKWWQFRFPSFWGADILQIAETFTALGYGADPRLANTFDIIRSKQDENGRWALEFTDRTHKMWVKYGVLGEPNKWVTLRALRVLKRASKGK
jgi:hypothetical protein